MTAKDENFSTIFFEKEPNITTQTSLLSQEEYIQDQELLPFHFICIWFCLSIIADVSYLGTLLSTNGQTPS